jgi:uncharacterized protein (DUF952 family)
MPEPIFHLALAEHWDTARPPTVYTVSTRGLELADVGFIHCSTRHQLEVVANGFYSDVDELIVLTIDPDAVDADVRWEPPTPGADDRYPHIYGPLPAAAVLDARPWRRAGRGWSLADLR